MKILKNHAVGICPISGRTKYEYLIFNLDKRTYSSIKATFAEAIELDYERISPLTAKNEGYFSFKKVA